MPYSCRFIIVLAIGWTLPASFAWSGERSWKEIHIDGGVSLYREALQGNVEALDMTCGIAADTKAPPLLRRECLAMCRSGIERLAPDRTNEKVYLERLLKNAMTIFMEQPLPAPALPRKPPVVSAACANILNNSEATERQLKSCCNVKLANRDIDGAISACSAALRINPNNSGAYHDRGVAWARKDNLAAAISDLNRAIEIDPRNSSFHYTSRADIKGGSGDLKGAVEDLTQAIDLESKNQNDNVFLGMLYAMRGRWLLLAGDTARAMRDYNHALYINPRSASMFLSRGYAHYLNGEYRYAIADIESSNVLEPDAQGFKSLLLYIVTAKIGGDGAQTLARHTSHIAPHEWPMPIVALFLGKSTPRKLFDSLQGENPYSRRDKVCQANYYVALWHQMKGDSTQAEHFLRETIRSCPKGATHTFVATAELKRTGALK